MLCDPMDGSLPGSSVQGILQARTLEWAAMPSSGDLPNPRIETQVSRTAGDSLPSEPPVTHTLTACQAFCRALGIQS